MNLNDLEREKDKPDIKALSREFCKLAGICWHEWDKPALVNQWYTCKLCQEISSCEWHPDFTDAREVLTVMRAREDYSLFLHSITLYWYHPSEEFVDLILDTTGLLLIEAVEFLRKEVENENG